MRSKRARAGRFLADVEGTPISDVLLSMTVGDEIYDAPGPWRQGMFGDLLLVADPSTFRPVPWEAATAAVMCDWRGVETGAVPIAPRTVLADQVTRLEFVGLTARAALEYEFFLYAETAETAAAKGWRHLTPAFPGRRLEDALRAAEQNRAIGEVIDLITAYGVPVEEVKVEGGPGQVEINLAPTPVLEACDHAARLKLSLKELLAARGLMASFLARPPDAPVGSSSHLHVSLWDGGVPAFWDGDAPDRMSDVMRGAIGGLMETMLPLAALFCPTVNSGRRLRDWSAAPTTVSWGYENKSVAVRTVTRSPEAIRLEHRLAGADANPYLLAAAMLAGMRHGIERKIDPPAPFPGVAWRVPELEALPRTLRQATEAMEASNLPATLFDPVFVSAFVASRRVELRHLDQTTTDWELARYTERV